MSRIVRPVWGPAPLTGWILDRLPEVYDRCWGDRETAERKIRMVRASLESGLMSFGVALDDETPFALAIYFRDRADLFVEAVWVAPGYAAWYRVDGLRFLASEARRLGCVRMRAASARPRPWARLFGRIGFGADGERVGRAETFVADLEVAGDG